MNPSIARVCPLCFPSDDDEDEDDNDDAIAWQVTPIVSVDVPPTPSRSPLSAAQTQRDTQHHNRS